MKTVAKFLTMLFVVSLVSSCDSSETQEELNETIEFEIQQTDHGDSVNSGGGENEDPSNEEG